MATKMPRSVLNAKSVWTLRDAPASQLVNNGWRHSLQRTIATTPSTLGAPPLLLKLRSDLKSAMKAKDTNRLNVLRSILAETTNAAKTSNPLRTDIQILALLRKQAATSRSAAQEFGAAKREDLQGKEMAQVAVLDEYAAGVETLGESEITAAIQDVIGKMRTDGKDVNLGAVIKELLGPEGALQGRPVENKEVARLVRGML